MKTNDPRSKTPIDIRLGRNLRSIRLSKEMSQARLAKKLGMTYQQVQKMECGINRIPASRIVMLADVFGCKISDFYQGLVNSEEANA